MIWQGIIKGSQGFFIGTKNTSYLLQVTKFGHLEHIYYGPGLQKAYFSQALYEEQAELEALFTSMAHKNTVQTGCSVNYSKSSDTYSLEHMCLEWSGVGSGDYRNSPLEMKMPNGSFVHDFIYQDYEIRKGTVTLEDLPSAYADEDSATSLLLHLMDETNGTKLTLIYTAFEQTDVITRRVVIENTREETLVLRRALSMSLDIPNRDYSITTFDGGWIKEAHKHQREVSHGTFVNSSTTGSSSNKHNPGILLSEKTATEDRGYVYGFNLVYSGNHYSAVELSADQLVRIQMGINGHCFEWELKKNQCFSTPEVAMSFSEDGFNGLSHHFHDFISEHIVRGDWKKKERPVKVNNWEAFFFDFTESKLLSLAKKAKDVGVELFVLDDGWFGERNSDKAGLGDYQVNRKKLPSGLDGFAKKIEDMGMLFGLWFEPEMINEDSNLYREHPEYAVVIPGKPPTLGRNQMVLNLCKKEVQDYIIEQVGRILDHAKISYVKWDMNRHMSDIFSETLVNQGEFYHRYMLGLYRVLGEIFYTRPHILLESCSSGGNRFDLGMLCFSPQIWTSDDTDPIERLKIQSGLSYLYPPSTMGAHVSSAPHQQTIRETTLATRFNVASFGCLGYELDLKTLSPVEKKEVKEQIIFYKKYRKTFQFGEFSRIENIKTNKVQWQVKEKDSSLLITGFYQTLSEASEGFDLLRVEGLPSEEKYQVVTKPQSIYIKKFGGLVKHMLPIHVKSDGLILRTANRLYCLEEGVEHYLTSGAALKHGILLENQFLGTGYQKEVRLLGDFGSNIYVIERVQ